MVLGLCRELPESEEVESDLAGVEVELVALLLLLFSWRLVFLESPFDLDTRDFIVILQSVTNLLAIDCPFSFRYLGWLSSSMNCIAQSSFLSCHLTKSEAL